MKKWRCMQTGDCCRMVHAVAVTPEELAAVRAAKPDVELTTRTRRDGMIEWRARPCPFLDGSRCGVWESRPYNCRRWMCGRFDTSEPPEDRAIPLRVLLDDGLRKQYRRNQREAQAWADAHGWRKDIYIQWGQR